MLQYILALLTILVFVILIIRKPQVETYVLYVMAVLPLMDTKILPLEYGFIKTFDVVSVISLILFFNSFVNFKKTNTFWGFLVLTISLWTFTLLSNVYSEFGFTNSHLLYQVFTIFIYTRFLFIYCRKWQNRYKVVKAFKYGFTIALIFMGLQILIGPQFSLGGMGLNVINETTGVIRYPGIFMESQYNTQFLAMGCFIFFVAKKNLSNQKKYLNYLGFAISVVFIFFAGGRSALGGFLIGILILFLAASVRIKMIGILAGLLFLSIYFISAPQNGIFSRSENLGDDINFRQEIWKETYTIIKKHPLLGVGFGNFSPYITKYHNDLYLEITPGEFTYFNQPENGYLKILVEQGVLAFSSFLLLILIPATRTALGLINKTIAYNMIFFLAGLSAWLVAFNTVYSLLDYRLLAMAGTWITMMILSARHPINVKTKILHDHNAKV